jgi:hypothetical protein
MLALGIGGNVALFSVFNGLFLKPLPIDQPEQIVDVDETAPKWNLEYTGVNYADFHAWREHTKAFSGLSAFSEEHANAAVNGEPRRLRGVSATHDLPRLLRIQPALGRFFNPDEDKPGANRVALISYDVWQQQYGGRRDMLGRGIELHGRGFEVIGVLPP